MCIIARCDGTWLDPRTRDLGWPVSPEFDTSQAYSYIVRTCLQNKRKKMCILYVYYLNLNSS